MFNNALPGYNFHFQINETNKASGIGIFLSKEVQYLMTTDRYTDGCEYL
jgi:hypothetical protein